MPGASAKAWGACRTAVASGTAPGTADPGAITLGAGALAYGVTMANGVVPLGRPNPPFIDIGVGGDTTIKNDAEYQVLTSAGTVDPQWTWYFSTQHTWLATVLALNPGTPPPPPAPATKLPFTVQPSTAATGSTISPP